MPDIESLLGGMKTFPAILFTNLNGEDRPSTRQTIISLDAGPTFDEALWDEISEEAGEERPSLDQRWTKFGTKMNFLNVDYNNSKSLVLDAKFRIFYMTSWVVFNICYWWYFTAAIRHMDED